MYACMRVGGCIPAVSVWMCVWGGRRRRAWAQLHGLGRGQRDQPVRAPSHADELCLFSLSTKGRGWRVRGEIRWKKKRGSTGERDMDGREKEVKQRGPRRPTEDREVWVRCELGNDRGVDGKEGEKKVWRSVAVWSCFISWCPNCWRGVSGVLHGCLLTSRLDWIGHNRLTSNSIDVTRWFNHESAFWIQTWGRCCCQTKKHAFRYTWADFTMNTIIQNTHTCTQTIDRNRTAVAN